MKNMVLSTVAGLFVIFGFSNAQALPDCNSTETRCASAYNYDGTSAETCVDTKAVVNCNFNAPYNYFHAACDASLGGYSCATLRGVKTSDESASQIAPNATCGATAAFCGWRDNVNKSPSTGSANSSRAKLHSCAVNGFSDEQYYGTSNSACQGYASDSSINGYCSSSVWSSFCSSAGFRNE